MHNLSKVYPLLFLCLFISLKSIAQSNYIPSYYITPENDTIYGLINFRNWDTTPKKVTFKTSETAQKEALTPEKVKSFVSGSQKYISAEVEIETSPFRTNDLNYEAKLQLKTIKTFLKTVVDGSKKLYMYKSRWGREYFYIQEDGNLRLLVHKRYLKDLSDGQKSSSVRAGGYTNTHSSQKIIENNIYRNQLKLYLHDWRDVVKKSRYLRYNEKSLKKIFMDYYKATGDNIAFESKDTKFSHHFEVMAGASATSVKLFHQNGTANSSPFTYSYAFGISSNIHLPKGLKNWSFRSELLYTPYSCTNTGISSFASTSHKGETIVSSQQLDFNPIVRYNYLKDDWGFFAGLGLSCGFSLGNEARAKSTRSYIGAADDYVVAYNLRWNEKPMEMGSLGELGLIYKRWSMGVRGEYGDGFRDSVLSTFHTIRFHALLAFSL